jgi:hypothetical protein
VSAEAETLRRAARLMRERAEAATCVFPWRAEGRDVTATQDYDGFDPDWNMGFTLAACMRQDEAEHIASWHPLVALAVADLLDKLAWLHDVAPEALGVDITGRVLKVARAYLSEAAKGSEAG